MREGREPDLEKPLNAGIEINLHVPALLPEDYVPDVHLRLILYKRISAAKSEDELRDLQIELIDRFGLLPAAAKNLLRIAALKRKAFAIGIEKIDASDKGGYVDFSSQASIDPLNIVQLVENESQVYRLAGAHRLKFRMDLSDTATRFREIEHLLDRLASGTVEEKAVG